MARYSDEIIEEVRQSNDIIDVISQYVHLKRSGRNYFGLCPFHNEKSPSFSVSPDKQIFHCFGCGVGGNVFTFLMKIEGINFIEAVQMLAEKSQIQLPTLANSGDSAKEELKAQDLLEGIKKQKEQIKSLKSQSTTKATTQNLQIEDINGVCVIIQSVDDEEMKTLVDNAKNKYEKVAILLIDTQGKIVAGVKNTTIKAGSWVKEVAQVMGGNGGGRDDFATAGGKDTQKIKEALQRAREIVLESI